MKIALILLLVAGCASVPPTIRVPVLVTPSCEPRNALEQCKPICLREGKKAIQAVEDDTQIGCNCGPWETRLDWHEIDRAIADAARRTDEQLAARERTLGVLRAELDAILKRNREAFERGER